MDPEAGRTLWAELHEVCGQPGYAGYRKFLSGWLGMVERVIGCKTCFKKVEKFMKAFPPPYTGDMELWAFCFHDFVNKELGKPLHHPFLTDKPLRDRKLIQ